jgi:membrane protease YdiL (CAAX protease family)
MESRDNANHTQKGKLRLSEHPWLSLLVVELSYLVSIILAGRVIFGVMGLSGNSPVVVLALLLSYQILTVFVFAYLVFRLPKGKRRFRQFLHDIGLTRVQPFSRLVLLTLSCYLILALSQAAASFVYRLFEGLPLTWSFVRQAFDLSTILPSSWSSYYTSIPSFFEEMAFRGIVLTVFLRRYSERQAIIFSALGFGLFHLPFLLEQDPVWTLGQVVWTFIIGLFYGYVFVRTRSLLPSMIIHYLSNVFLSFLSAYMEARASLEIQALYGIILSIGVVPTTLMILWAKFFTSRWLPANANRELMMEETVRSTGGVQNTQVGRLTSHLS